MEGMDILKFIFILIGFCSILFLTYITTKFIGGKQSKAMKGKNINIIETVALGMDKRLYLVKAGKQYVLIASTSKSVEFLTVVELDENDNGQEAQINGGLFEFKKIFEKYTGTMRNEGKSFTSVPETETTCGIDETNNFKTNLDRLRSIIKKNTYQVKENGVDTTNEK